MLTHDVATSRARLELALGHSRVIAVAPSLSVGEVVEDLMLRGVAAAQENKRWARGGGGRCSGFASDCGAAAEIAEDCAERVKLVDSDIRAAQSQHPRRAIGSFKAARCLLTSRAGAKRVPECAGTECCDSDR
jgi:hypothetical protein